MTRCFACVVEGHGEVEAVPVLVRRIARDLYPTDPDPVCTVFRVPRSKLVQSGELERSIDVAARRVQPHGAILILIDADDDCPARLGPELLKRARAVTSLPVGVVLAKREFEAWFLAAAQSLRGRRRLAEDLEPPPDPETIRGAKEWLRRHQVGRYLYSARTDQTALTAVFDMARARRVSSSFGKCYREIARLLEPGSADT